jgi:hypothetical protein
MVFFFKESLSFKTYTDIFADETILQLGFQETSGGMGDGGCGRTKTGGQLMISGAQGVAFTIFSSFICLKVSNFLNFKSLSFPTFWVLSLDPFNMLLCSLKSYKHQWCLGTRHDRSSIFDRNTSQVIFLLLSGDT